VQQSLLRRRPLGSLSLEGMDTISSLFVQRNMILQSSHVTEIFFQLIFVGYCLQSLIGIFGSIMCGVPAQR
jgi:hypothetical protein